MTTPHFTLDKIKFGTDKPTLEKAFKLYESGKVTQVRDNEFSFSAVVLGT